MESKSKLQEIMKDLEDYEVRLIDLPTSMLSRKIAELLSKTYNACMISFEPSLQDKNFPFPLFKELYDLCQLSDDCFVEHADYWSEDYTLTTVFSDILRQYNLLLSCIIQREDARGEIKYKGDLLDVKVSLERCSIHTKDRIELLGKQVEEKEYLSNTIARYVTTEFESNANISIGK